MLSFMTLITIVLVFILGWCPLLTYLVSLIPLHVLVAHPALHRLVAHLERHVVTYAGAIGYGLLFNALLAFIAGWVVAIVNLVS